MTIDSHSIANINFAIRVSLLVAMVRGQDWSSVFRNTESRSVWDCLPLGLHNRLDVLIHGSRSKNTWVSDANRSRMVMENSCNLRMSKAIIDSLDNIIRVGDISIHTWIKWINVLSRQRTEQKNASGCDTKSGTLIVTFDLGESSR